MARGMDEKDTWYEWTGMEAWIWMGGWQVRHLTMMPDGYDDERGRKRDECDDAGWGRCLRLADDALFQKTR